MRSKRVAAAVGCALALAGIGPSCGGATGPEAGEIPDWAVCDGPGQCVVMTRGCCPPCGVPSLADVAGVHEARQAAFRAVTCTDPDPSCPECPTRDEPNLVAFCVGGRCAPIDLRTSELSACAVDGDCVLRYPECCERCIADPHHLVAIAAERLGDYRNQVCRPGQPCPACLPQYPVGYVAVCGAEGHCAVELRPKLCPQEVPFSGSACDRAGLDCEYGQDLRPSCRTHATCSGAIWQLDIPDCAPLPAAGEGSCPTELPGLGSACDSEGLICAMGGGDVCACGRCVGGPCSLEPRWVCAPAPAPPCPPVAPEIGAACGERGLVCIYGVCATATSAGRRCETGVWQDEGVACPL